MSIVIYDKPLVSPIGRDEAFRIIQEAHPEFIPLWTQHVEWWDNKEPGITNDFSPFIQYVIGLIENEEVNELVIALKIIEKLLLEGDDNVKYGVTIGFLEGITNNLLASDSRKSILFVNNLQPATKKFCIKLDKFWGTEVSGLHDQ